jgi:hypothetical protein
MEQATSCERGKPFILDFGLIDRRQFRRVRSVAFRWRLVRNRGIRERQPDSGDTGA